MEVVHHIFFTTRITPLSIDELNAYLRRAINNNLKEKIVSLNLHSLYLQFRSEKLREIQQQSIVRIDGMPIVFLARFLGLDVRRECRVTWMDWKDEFLALCNENRYRVFYLGSEPKIESKIHSLVTSRYPDINFKNRNGFFKVGSSMEQAIIEEINAFNPDILLVGMGMPRQEYWIADNYEKLDVNVLLSCGAAMEYITGLVQVPPRWMGRIGLEWLFRFLEQPKRFFYRYLIEPWILVFFLIKNKIKN